LIGGYLEEYYESRGGSLQWFTQVARISTLPGYQPASEWVAVALGNATVTLAVVFAWIHASSNARGDLMAGIVTGCGVAFTYYSLSETGRARGTDYAAFWNQPRDELREARRPIRIGSR